MASAALPDIPVSDLRFCIREVTALPNTQSGNRPLPTPDRQPNYWTRMSFFRQLRDGRRFVNDERGVLYVLDTATAAPAVFFDFKLDAPDVWSRMQLATGNSAGFVGFAFHPELLEAGKAGYGKLYTIHTEVAPRAHEAGFTDPYIPRSDETIRPSYNLSDLRHHTVISEWTITHPMSNRFTGGPRRELLRVGHPTTSYFHPFQDMQFRPGAEPGDADHGLLYISGGDWGLIDGRGAGGAEASSDNPMPGALQRLDTLAGTMIRIDPRPASVTGGLPGIGDYTIPPDNPFARDGDPKTLGEIWAYGFRNAHRAAWDNDGTMVITDAGHATAEEVDVVHKGKNYGWPYREGTFINGLDTEHGGSGSPDTVVPLTADADSAIGLYTYPIVEYGYNGTRALQAIAGGFIYRGRALPELRGKFVFGDMDLGDLYYADWGQMKALDAMRSAGKAPMTATIVARELRLLDESGNTKILADFVEAHTGSRRTDLRFGLGIDGELYLLTGPDGRIRQLISPTAGGACPGPRG